MLKKHFEDLCKEVFFFLTEEYSFKVVETGMMGYRYIWTTFKNSTTAIQPSYEFLEDFTTVKVVRLVDGNIPSYSPNNWKDVYEIVPADRINDLKYASARCSETTIEHSLKPIFMQYAVFLKQYCTPVLRGDFTIFEKLNTK